MIFSMIHALITMTMLLICYKNAPIFLVRSTVVFMLQSHSGMILCAEQPRVTMVSHGPIISYGIHIMMILPHSLISLLSVAGSLQTSSNTKAPLASAAQQ